jgi:prepilin-type N-terminal cleavage/methylation domain-containing protein/prepilin-type processing-associated H-X9-DG protein
MQHAFHIRHPKRAFTLVELLLVITIIAIVLALILVAVQSLQNSARATACLSNQRQLALANQTYATDNNGRLSSPRTDSSAIVGGGLPTLPNCWVDTNNTVCSGNRETDAALKKGSLWTYLGENSKVYVSPMDPTARRDFTDTSPPANCPDGRVRSYSFNAFVGVGALNPAVRCDDFWTFPDPESPDYPDIYRGSQYKTVTMSQIPTPSRTMATIAEEDAYNFNLQGFCIRVRPPGGLLGDWIDTPALWNPGRVNISYMDGSVEAPNIIYKELAEIMQPNPNAPPIHFAQELGERPAHRFMTGILLPGILRPDLQ